MKSLGHVREAMMRPPWQLEAIWPEQEMSDASQTPGALSGTGPAWPSWWCSPGCSPPSLLLYRSLVTEIYLKNHNQYLGCTYKQKAACIYILLVQSLSVVKYLLIQDILRIKIWDEKTKQSNQLVIYEDCRVWEIIPTTWIPVIYLISTRDESLYSSFKCSYTPSTFMFIILFWD